MNKKSVIVILMFAFLIIPLMHTGAEHVLQIEVTGPNSAAVVVYKTVAYILAVIHFVLCVSVIMSYWGRTR